MTHLQNVIINSGDLCRFFRGKYFERSSSMCVGCLSSYVCYWGKLYLFTIIWKITITITFVSQRTMFCGRGFKKFMMCLSFALFCFLGNRMKTMIQINGFSQICWLMRLEHTVVFVSCHQLFFLMEQSASQPGFHKQKPYEYIISNCLDRFRCNIHIYLLYHLLSKFAVLFPCSLGLSVCLSVCRLLMLFCIVLYVGNGGCSRFHHYPNWSFHQKMFWWHDVEFYECFAIVSEIFHLIFGTLLAFISFYQMGFAVLFVLGLFLLWWEQNWEHLFGPYCIWLTPFKYMLLHFHKLQLFIFILYEERCTQFCNEIITKAASERVSEREKEREN